MMFFRILIIINVIRSLNAECEQKNIACNKFAIQSSTYTADINEPNKYGNASLAIDGNFTTDLFDSNKIYCSHTMENEANSWLQIDLIYYYFVDKVILLGRNKASHRLDNFIVSLSNVSMPNKNSLVLCGQWSALALVDVNMTLYCSYQTKPARYIVVEQPSTYRGGALTVCEIQAFGQMYQNTFECPVGLYGDGCTKVCHCANGLPCNQGNGYCHNGCHQDWIGDTCDTYRYNLTYTNMENCYNDVSNLATLIESHDNTMTVFKCITICKEKEYIFAALYKGKECHCGHELFTEGITPSIVYCSEKCPGNSNEACGGNSNNYKSVYKVCPPYYFGYKCRFKCECRNNVECRYPDGSCSNSNNECKTGLQNWISPTCHLRSCLEKQQCDAHGVCDSIEINHSLFWYCNCSTGYTFVDDSCIDKDECKTPANTCDSESQDCFNTIGSYNCSCKPGFYRELSSGQLMCLDIDECKTNNTPCFKNQTCLNIKGSYACQLQSLVPNTPAPKEIWPIIVGVVLGVIFFILLVILLVILIRRYKRNNDHVSSRSKIVNSNTAHANNTNNNETSFDEENPYSKVNKKNYDEEFKKLPNKPLRSHEYGRLKENRPKNRFRNITPYDDNRLKLKVINGDSYSDYVNATLIPTFGGKNIIATQGPNPESINDFWRMVHEYNVVIIAMLCNLKENDKVKCDQYWPSTGQVTYGDFTVEFKNETKWMDFTKRSLVFQTASGEVRVILQYQFTGWPDHGVPDNVSSLLTMRNMIRNDNNNGMLLIHCSAGVGRTGCYIAIDSVLEARRTNKEISVFDFVNEMRNKRQQMVQTVEQYKFIYTTVSTHISTGLTVHTLQELSERFANGGNAHSDYLLHNQWNILENQKRNQKNAHNRKQNQIENMFSELVFTMENNLTTDFWRNNQNSNICILLADEEESNSILPSLEKAIELSNEKLTLVHSDPTEFGFTKIIVKSKKEEESYANLPSNVYANSGVKLSNEIEVYQITLNRFDHFDFRRFLSIYESLIESKSLVAIAGTNTELSCYMMLAMFTLDAMRKRKYICIFQIIQHLYLKYKDFHISEEAYIHLHKIMLQYK